MKKQRTLEPINRKKVDAHLLGGFGMSDRCALVNDDAVMRFQESDHFCWIIPRRLENANACI